MPAGDPYKTLGVDPGASDEQIRIAYRRLVKLHHPDHNHGSADAARRFEEVQEAYARVKSLRGAGAQTPPRQGAPRADRSTPRPGSPGGSPPRVEVDPDVDQKLADLERELREAHAASERARRAAREAVADATGRPSDDQLGYVSTDDSFGKILADAGSQLADRLSQAADAVAGAPQHPAAKRVSDLIAELEHLTSKLTGESKP